jgi:hypothetical protein
MSLWKNDSKDNNTEKKIRKRRFIKTYVGRKNAAPPLETRPVPVIWKKSGQ